MEGFVLAGLIIALIILGAKYGGGVFRPHDLRTASKTPYAPRPVMGYEEARVLYALEKWVRGRKRRERVFPQVPMGAYLQTPDDDAHRVIRHKRPDYVIVDHKGMPLCVVEYQGSGHYQGDAAHRDKVKQAALKNADIPLIELFPDDKDDPERIFQKLDAVLGAAS